MTFLDIINMTLNRVNEDTKDPDPLSLEVIKNGVNQGYMLLAATADQRVSEVTLPYSSSSPLVLPIDCVDIVNVKHSILGDLSAMDFEKKANLLYIRSRDVVVGDVVLTYIQFPVVLVNDTDIVYIRDGYVYALSSYAAYVYQLSRKKYAAAQLLLAEFNSFMAYGEVTNSDVEGNL